jgi:acetylglutamate kinase
MKIVVIKCGGAALQSQEQVSAIMRDIAEIKTLGMHPIVVHGGGPEISKMCKKVGISPQFSSGLRVTSREIMPIVQMVLIGKINKELVLQLNQKGAFAVGLSGYDGNLLLASKLENSNGIDLGFVGEITRVNSEFLRALIQSGCIPVIAPVAPSLEGVSFNINADSVASQIAISMKADHLIFLSDVPGVLDGTKTIVAIESHEAQDLMASGIIQGGMIPKVEGALAALQQGVEKIHILDGKAPHSLLLHLQGVHQTGTTLMVRK